MCKPQIYVCPQHYVFHIIKNIPATHTYICKYLNVHVHRCKGAYLHTCIHTTYYLSNVYDLYMTQIKYIAKTSITTSSYLYFLIANDIVI